ncbi:DUF202 domain-containing protein [Streptantibioticus parmotrematis]|uniref:DUF202 domain-containing protein n=1 Tax=Streptantibioticus parmotrematis TaxID=2873249 RepID=UPI0033DD055C
MAVEDRADTRMTTRRQPGSAEGPALRDALAADRTYLAWVRTCLALLAAGGALSALPGQRHIWHRLVGLLLLLAAGALAVLAHRQHTRCRRLAGPVASQASTPWQSRLLSAVVVTAVAVLTLAAGLRLGTDDAHRTAAQQCRRYECPAPPQHIAPDAGGRTSARRKA